MLYGRHIYPPFEFRGGIIKAQQIFNKGSELLTGVFLTRPCTDLPQRYGHAAQPNHAMAAREGTTRAGPPASQLEI